MELEWGPSKYYSYQLWVKLAVPFQRRRFFIFIYSIVPFSMFKIANVPENVYLQFRMKIAQGSKFGSYCFSSFGID